MPSLKTWLILSVVCLASCKEGPKVSFCVLDAPASVLRCADPEGKPFDLELKAADNYGCVSPDDWEKILKGVAKNPAVKTAAKQVKIQLSANAYIKEKYATVLKQLP